MPKLWGLIFSPNVQRVLIVAHELGVHLDQVVVDIRTGDNKKPDYLAKNPFGEIPYFEDEAGVKLWESRAIIRYLDAAHGYKFGKANTPKEYAVVELWSAVEVSQFNPNAGDLVYESFFKPLFGGTPNADRIGTLKEKLSKVLDIYEEHLKNHGPYFTGAEFTLADLYHIPISFLLFHIVHPQGLEKRPHVKAWFEKVTARESVKAVFKQVSDAKAALAKQQQEQEQE